MHTSSEEVPRRRKGVLHQSAKQIHLLGNMYSPNRWRTLCILAKEGFSVWGLYVFDLCHDLFSRTRWDRPCQKCKKIWPRSWLNLVVTRFSQTHSGLSIWSRVWQTKIHWKRRRFEAMLSLSRASRVGHRCRTTKNVTFADASLILSRGSTFSRG